MAGSPSAKSAPSRRRDSDLTQAWAACRSAFGMVAIVSMVINLLNLTSPLYMQQIYDRVLSTGHLETLVFLTMIAAVALMLFGALEAVRSALTVRIGCWLNERLGPAVLASGVRARLLGDGAGSQPLRDLAQVQNFISTQGLSVFFDAPWVPIFLLLIWMLHPVLGMLATGTAVVMLLLNVANEYVTRGATVSAAAAQMAANQQAEITIRNAEVVRAMGMMPALIQRWQTVNGGALDAIRNSAERGGVLIGVSKFLRVMVQVGTLGAGAMLVLKGELTPGGMISASILLGRALAPVEMAMSAWRNFTATRVAYARLANRLKNFPPEPERTRLPTPRGRLSVEGVTFVPPGSRDPVLHEVSFAVDPGEAIAIVGPSASGKSTLCRLLVGVMNANSGEVRLDGAELVHWENAALGRHIGYLPQDVELFGGTVRENIARMGLDAPHADVVEAARMAHAHEMILRLPQGYETQIGDGGARLSGGQRQRIGLARAVYGAPRLIILDEPNANLDQTGEAALAAAIEELKGQGAAVIIVGHRPSTVAQADKILLLRGGRVDMFGPRDKVLQELRRVAAANGHPGTTPMQKPEVAEAHAAGTLSNQSAEAGA